MSDPFKGLQATLDRQIHYTQIMCAGTGDREFKEKDVTRAKGRFATKEEKAAAAKKIEDDNKKALSAAPPGLVSLPDGQVVYKLSGDENKKINDAIVAGIGGIAELDSVIEKAKMEPEMALMILQKKLDDLDRGAMAAIENKSIEAAATVASKTAPIKAKAIARITKAVTSNMSSDEVRKGMVEVSKTLNSGELIQELPVMTMLKKFATSAQTNLDREIQKIKTNATESADKALSAGVGLIMKIAAQNPEATGAAMGAGIGAGIGAGVGGAIGYVVGSGVRVVNNTTNAIGNKINEAGFSTDDLGGDLAQVAKDLEIDFENSRKATIKSIDDGFAAFKREAESGLKAIDPILKESGSILAINSLALSVPPVIGGLVGGAVAGPIGVIMGAETGGTLGFLGTLANLAERMGSPDSDYYTKQLAAIKTSLNKAKDTIETSFNKLGTEVESDLAKIDEGAKKLKDQISKIPIGAVTSDGQETVGSELVKLKDSADRLKDQITNSTAAKLVGGGIKNVENSIEGGVKNIQDPNFQAHLGASALIAALDLTTFFAYDKKMGRPLFTIDRLIGGSYTNRSIQKSVDRLVPSNRAATQAPGTLKNSQIITRTPKQLATQAPGTLKNTQVVEIYPKPKHQFNDTASQAKAAVKSGAIGDVIKSVGSGAIALVSKPAAKAIVEIERSAKETQAEITTIRSNFTKQREDRESATMKRSKALAIAQANARKSAAAQRDRASKQALARLN